MGRFVTVQTYGDNNPAIAALPYDKASGGKTITPGAGSSGPVKVPKVNNVSGSTAGAGSNNFHEYRAERSREFFRLKRMDDEAEQERLDTEFKRKVEENRLECEKKTAANRAKRLKRKAKLAAKSGGKPRQGPTGGAGAEKASDGEDSEDEEEEEKAPPTARPVPAPLAAKEDATAGGEKRRKTAADVAGDDSDESC